MRDVFVTLGYTADLRAALPVSYLEFWLAKQDEIDQRARRAFDGPRPPEVDPDYDIVELRGHWADGNCDYFVNAWLRPDDTIDLISITFDFDPIKIDPEPWSPPEPQTSTPPVHFARGSADDQRSVSSAHRRGLVLFSGPHHDFKVGLGDEAKLGSVADEQLRRSVEKTQ